MVTGQEEAMQELYDKGYSDAINKVYMILQDAEKEYLDNNDIHDFIVKVVDMIESGE